MQFSMWSAKIVGVWLSFLRMRSPEIDHAARKRFTMIEKILVADNGVHLLAVVHSYEDNKAFEIEFIAGHGGTVAVVTLKAEDIRLMQIKKSCMFGNCRQHNIGLDNTRGKNPANVSP